MIAKTSATEPFGTVRPLRTAVGPVVPDGTVNFEAVANTDPGAPLGREPQIAELPRLIKHNRVAGTVRLTAAVYYTSAQRYQSAQAALADFAPFWEFVTGPLNVGAFTATALDGTFGPEQTFAKAPARANVSWAEGHRFFGEVGIDGHSGEPTVRLREEDGVVLFTKVSSRAWWTGRSRRRGNRRGARSLREGEGHRPRRFRCPQSGLACSPSRGSTRRSPPP